MRRLKRWRIWKEIKSIYFTELIITSNVVPQRQSLLVQLIIPWLQCPRGICINMKFIRIMQYFDINYERQVLCVRTVVFLQCHRGCTTQEIINSSHAVLLYHIHHHRHCRFERPISRGNVKCNCDDDQLHFAVYVELLHLMDFY